MAIEQVNASQAPQPRRTSRIFGRYIIKSHFQFKFSLIVFLFLSVVAILVFLEGHIAVENMISTGAVTSEESIVQLQLLNSIIGRTCILGLAITFGLSLFFSHLVAGPIYRFQKTLEEMRDGKLNIRVQLRKHDELKDVADSFNQALSSLRNKLHKERDGINVAVDKIQLVVKKLEKAGRATEANELSQLLADIKNNPQQVQI